MVKPPCWVSLEPVDWELKHTADGSEIRRSPVDMVNIPLFAGFHTCLVMQDFFRQEYHLNEMVPLPMFMVSHPMRGSLTRNQNLLTTSATGRLLNFQQPFQDSVASSCSNGHFRTEKKWKMTHTL